MIIALLTDFGTSDPYAGIMKGVILGINPDVKVVDITHAISPQNIDEGACILNNCYAFFPEQTLFVVVVDPGVGSNRNILLVKAENQLFLAPDNGVLKYIFYAHPDAEVFRINNEAYFLPAVSATFQGRDIFAPVAGHLSAGVAPAEMGEPVSDFIHGEVRLPDILEKQITGEILYFDHFGNAVSNIDKKTLRHFISFDVVIGKKLFNQLSVSYTDVRAGEPLALIGSNNTVEISVNQGSAQKQLSLKAGDRVEIRNLKRK